MITLQHYTKRPNPWAATELAFMGVKVRITAHLPNPGDTFMHMSGRVETLGQEIAPTPGGFVRLRVDNRSRPKYFV